MGVAGHGDSMSKLQPGIGPCRLPFVSSGNGPLFVLSNGMTNISSVLGVWLPIPGTVSIRLPGLSQSTLILNLL